ncbi:conserved Plasmodium protein, unknown function [Plasmodium vinckei brucechwatti]|uniref:Uncharacterized protein n=1 Tax=Plasmodium vinckei brucechwatti TaxID=119398 RepID=A0A6V7S165_PLAVN|nr:conserved Plasmodium protein, unknown function [Plasmodium vinckei brucechwatti]
MAKGSAKELFRQMKNELRYGGEEQNCLEVVSCDMSSEYEDFKTYHNEIKYLKKEQLKAYICKLRKEIKNYKNREINYIIEIKYLRRKIIRLQNVIENDKVLKRYEQNFFLNNEKRGYSLKNYNNNNRNLGLDENLIFTANNFNNNNRQNSINKSEKKYRSGTSLTYNNNNNNANNYINRYNNNCNSNSSVCRRSYGGKSCFKSDSIRSINQDIHKGRRIVSAKDLCFDNKRGEEYEKYNGISRGIDGTKELWAKSEKKNGSKKIIHTIKPIEKVYSCGKAFDFNKKTLNNKNYENSSDKYRTDRRDHSLYNLNLYKNTKNICSEKGEKKDIYISSRSYSSASKFELKRHLISNNKNMNRMSSHINSIIEKDINKYYNSKESILNQRSGKVNKNTFDIYNDAYHKKILSKKYTSPYAYQNSAKNSSNKKIDIIRRNIKNVETKYSNQVVGSDYIDMKGDIKKGTRTNLIKKNDIDNAKLEDDCNSSSPINKIKQYLQSEKKKKKKKKSEKKPEKKTEKKSEKKVAKKKASKIIENEKEDENEKDEKRKNDNWGTTLKWKGRQSSEKSETCFNHITEKETNSIEDNNTNLSNLKKVIQSDLKENFKQELEKLKKRNNILISKPHVYCGIPFDSTSGGSEKDNYSNSNNNTKKINENKNKISVNYLKGPSISNAPFNDIEKRISNLQNYLKKNKK